MNPYVYPGRYVVVHRFFQRVVVVCDGVVFDYVIGARVTMHVRVLWFQHFGHRKVPLSVTICWRSLRVCCVSFPERLYVVVNKN